MNTVSAAIHYESILSTITLIITFAGLNFLNDRLGKPTIKLVLKNIIVCSTYEPEVKAVALDIVNHSLVKVFISNIQIEYYQGHEKSLANMLVDGSSGRPFVRCPLEPGEKFRFTITLDQFELSQQDYNSRQLGRAIVTTETSHRFYVRKNTVRRAFEKLEI
ncbi:MULTISPECIES: hypothetical protein [Vibrio harveyi group]|uniref:hypothetical protein n=1 Tax=Vibrio harveyi group TaxID=717610 RepID=UPI0004A475B1|nr:hypothetical protein [Vibrio parahaemolyticus]EGR0027701.1 hypothetical protein [Vibrio alginolyticus]EHR0228191.1 hypothetical protein [Vibrio parahaemolyticus]MRE03852.1 hypothetical protein [Vibrio parahaemolyticus]RXP62019.1 hypothetical protein EGL73_00445 [Vibrio parahaemolyticus]RXP63740.1 hypothetical protein EGL72_00430 [Vibrio parahaemolyticus]